MNIRKTLVGWLIRVCDERANGFGALTGLVTGMITVFLFDQPDYRRVDDGGPMERDPSGLLKNH